MELAEYHKRKKKPKKGMQPEYMKLLTTRYEKH
jgi:hypothetical protein